MVTALIVAGPVGLSTCPQAWAQMGLGFTKIADTTSASPSGGTFGTFGRPVIDGDTVVFWNFNATQEGIYKYSGGTLSTVADRNTAMPNTTNGKFTHFNQPSLSGDHISFSAEWVINTVLAQTGVYSAGPGGILRVADRTTEIPSGGGQTFNSFDSITSVFNDSTTFYGGGVSYWGVYKGSGGTLSFLVGATTAIPGGAGNFTGTVGSSLEGDTLVFKGIGANSQQGIYLFNGGSVSRIADKSTQVPGASVNFMEFGFPTRSGDQTVFMATGTDSYYGIYRHDGIGLVTVIDRTTPVPSAKSGTFAGQIDGPISGETRVPVDSSGNVVFGGGGAFNGGYFVYTASTGTIALLMRANASIDDHQISAIYFSEQAISGRKIAMRADFSGVSGIYLAEISSFARNVSGLWDTAANWSFNAVPGLGSSTLITPGVNVTGPSAATTVRSLEVISYVVDPSVLTLQASGPLTATEGVRVNINGILAGSGSLLAGTGKSVIVRGSPAGVATLSPGGSAVGTIDISGKLVLGENSDFRVDLNTDGQCDVVHVTGDVDLSSSLGKRIVFVTPPTGASGSDYTFFTYTGTRTGTFNPTSVPQGYAIDYTVPGQVILKAPPVTDADHDGILDSWELAQAGDLTTLSATGDADDDGSPDVSEYIADTDPLDSTQFLQITAFHFEPFIEVPDPEEPDQEPFEEVEISVTWDGRAACRYAIETASSPSGPWVVENDGIETGNAIANQQFTLSPIPAELFVRIIASRPVLP
jgi:hypothetical protein